ncbi:MAG: GGDEF domain-containing protein, partial [Deltaproteobacteria bacterium HGW-Deltaproteobacteria-20]
MTASKKAPDEPVVLHSDDDEESTTIITDRSLVSWPIAASDRETCDVLTVVSGPDRGGTFNLREPHYRVGRGSTCQIRVKDDSMSRVHALLSRGTDGGWVLVDAGSKNGSFVEGRQVAQWPLNEGDVVQLGFRTAFRFARLPSSQAALVGELYESSVRDPLTGASNRRHFDERLRAAVSFGVRHKTDLVLMMLDLDHFKRVNDTLGHPAGDRVLKHVSGVLRGAIRTEDVLGRYGGEEFTVLAPGIDVKGGAALGERLRALVEGTSVPWEEEAVRVTVSIGVATLATSGRTPDGQRLFRDADACLYRAKAQGRNRVVAPLP